MAEVANVDQDMLQGFQTKLSNARHVVVLTGAGTSAESGIPTFRGAGGLWRKFDAMSLAFEEHCKREGKKFTLITQNIDRLHQAAGSKSVLELHGSLWDVCGAHRNGMKRNVPWEDRRQPLVPALAGTGAPDVTRHANIPKDQLPCDGRGRLLRPGVVWFGEDLDPKVLDTADEAVASCDVFMSIGTSSVAAPAANFVNQASMRGVTIAEVNLDTSDATRICQYVFQGRAGELLPDVLRVSVQDLTAQDS